MSPFILALLLLLLGLALLGMEPFVPSGGALSILSAMAICVSLGIVFYYGGLRPGTLYTVFLAIVLPVFLYFAIRMWPHTPIGRALLNLPQGEGADRERVSDPGFDERLADLLGAHGVAKSHMLPSGAIKIDGHVWDAVSEGSAIDAGQPVKVIRVEGNRIVVRVVEPDEIGTADAADDNQPDLLARPISEILPNTFDVDEEK